MNKYYLYIAEEQGFSEFSKIGVTNQPFERLRKLQQGNPRRLRFVHLFCGHRTDVETIELWVKQICWWQKTEWFNIPPAELKELVIAQYKKLKERREECELSRRVEFREVVDRRIIPYQSRTKLTCTMNIHSLTIDQLYENGNVIS